ncbi:MAG: zinc ribbon domain-containing protein [Clostridia bacterium]|nr:zinc ribbon domain-containing protein [Clostridia bacterium]
MYCQNCGNRVQDGADFCSVCGTPVSKEENGVQKSYAKGFGIASLITTIGMFVSIHGDQEGAVVYAAMALVFGLISLFESFRTKKMYALAYVSIICALMFIIVQSVLT